MIAETTKIATRSDFEKHIKGNAVNDFRLPEEAHIGYVHLQVSNLKRSLHFYETLVGFKRAIEVGNSVVLSASGKAPYHIMLTELPGARPKPARSSGLYHIAIRFPSRRELAKVFRRLYMHETAFQGFSDHLVSEAIYLADPDENGVELYVDRPRAEWVMQENQVQMATLPLNLDSLLGELQEGDSDADPIDSNTDIGHVHLQVADLPAADEFYHGLLGFDVTQRSYPGALFLSAGGYHHHIGVNTWGGRGVPPPPSDAAGLLSFGISVLDQQAMNSIAQQFEIHGTPFTIKEHEVLHTKVLRVKSPDALDVEFFEDSGLKSQNSEFRIQNSELKSQNSELRTQDQELSTKNQELSTKNQELRTKNQELRTETIAHHKQSIRKELH